MHRRTIGKEVSRSGVQMHQGGTSSVTLKPAVAGAGITLVRIVESARKEFGVLRPELVQPMPMATILKNGDGVTVSTVEHLVAALAGLGITDIEIEVAGAEVPIMDGSALPWVEALDEAGLVWLDGEVAPMVVAQDVVLQENETRKLMAVPGEGWRMVVKISMPHPMIGAQEFGGVVTEEFFRKEIAPARTFAIEKDLKTAMAWGLAKGATLEGGVLFQDDGGIANPEGLRFADEPVRHKFLDAMGDLYLTGRPWAASFDLTAPGHSATNGLLREVLKVSR